MATRESYKPPQAPPPGDDASNTRTGEGGPASDALMKVQVLHLHQVNDDYQKQNNQPAPS